VGCPIFTKDSGKLYGNNYITLIYGKPVRKDGRYGRAIGSISAGR
jgi:hypothetical protein